MRSLLNSLSTVEIVLVFVVGVAVLAVCGVVLAERTIPRLRSGSFGEGSSAIQNTFTLLFGLILALTIAGLTLNSDTANTAVTHESTALAQLTRVSVGFNRSTRLRLKAAIDQYVHAIAEDEFATMRDGKASPLAAAALANLYGVYQGYKPRTSELTAYEASTGKVDEITGIRRERLQISGQSLSPLLRIMLVLGTIAFIVLSYPAQIQHRRTRIAVVGLIAGFVTFVLVLTIVLDYPYSGDLATSSQPYKEAVLAQYWPGI